MPKDRKAKILQLITMMTPGGAQEKTVLIANNLDGNKFDVWLATSDSEEGDFLSKVDPQRATINRIPFLKRNISPICDIFALVYLYLYFRKEKFDIVHTRLPKVGILGRLAAKLAGVPVIIYTVHTFPFHDHQGKLKNTFFILLERLAAKFTDKIITNSNLNIAKSLSHKIGKSEQYITIYSAFEMNKFRNVKVDKKQKKVELGLSPDKPIVGTIGRMSKQKNPLCFVKSVKEVSAHFPEVQFIMVGGEAPFDSLHKEVSELISKLNLDEKVKIFEYRNDVPEILSILDVFVHTSLYEGMGRILGEALLVNTPVVATAVDGVPEVIQDNKTGLLVPPDEPQALAKAIIRMLENRYEAKRMAESGKAWVEKRFKADLMVRRTGAVYDEMLIKKCNN